MLAPESEARDEDEESKERVATAVFPEVLPRAERSPLARSTRWKKTSDQRSPQVVRMNSLGMYENTSKRRITGMACFKTLVCPQPE